MAADSPMRTDDMLWLLGSLCRIGRVPFDAALVAQRFPPPNDRGTLREAAQALGFKTGQLATAKADSAILPLPCIGFTPRHDAAPRDPAGRRGHLHLIEPGSAGRAASQASGDEGAPTDDIRPALLLRIEDRRLVYFCAGSEAPQSIDMDELGGTFESPLILVSVADHTNSVPPRGEKPALVDVDPVDTAPPRFGLRWFVPELLRHKRIWQDVLLA